MLNQKALLAIALISTTAMAECDCVHDYDTKIIIGFGVGKSLLSIADENNRVNNAIGDMDIYLKGGLETRFNKSSSFRFFLDGQTTRIKDNTTLDFEKIKDTMNFYIFSLNAQYRYELIPNRFGSFLGPYLFYSRLNGKIDTSSENITTSDSYKTKSVGLGLGLGMFYSFSPSFELEVQVKFPILYGTKTLHYIGPYETLEPSLPSSSVHLSINYKF